MKSDGKLRNLLWIKDGGSAHPIEEGYEFKGDDKVFMNGTDVFKVAVKQMCRAAQKVVEATKKAQEAA